MDSFNCEWLKAGDTSVSTSFSTNVSSSFPTPWWEEHSSDTRSVKELGSTCNTCSVPAPLFPDKDFRVQDQDEAAGWAMALRGEVFCETKKVESSALDWRQVGLETIGKHFGLTLKEAASSLQVSSTMLKRKCRELGIPRWPRKKYDVNCLIASVDSAKDNKTSGRKYEDISLQSMLPSTLATSSQLPPTHATQLPSTLATSSQIPSSQAAALPMGGFMTIKAHYGAYTIVKFKLPFSSPLLQMEREVALRLKLELGDFKIWYQDEDDEYALLTCDEDLRTMESMGKSIVRVSITSRDSAPG